MHPYIHAQNTPDKAAAIVAETGEAMGYAALDSASNQVAHFFRSEGLMPGDAVGVLVENSLDYFAIAWGAQRSGIRFVCISTKLTTDEVDYILADSGAKMIIASASLASTASALSSRDRRFAHGGKIDGFESFEDALAGLPVSPVADQCVGAAMLYSSGTTGRPKGIVREGPSDQTIEDPTSLTGLAGRYFGLGAHSIYLSTAPLYHAAPIGWTMAVHQLGGTVVMMKKFEAEAALAHIERYDCNAGQFVPTHFVRMLKLPEEVRARYDVSSMKVAIHAAAPCPIPIKRTMIDWWGPVLDEYYAGSEGNGFCAIKSPEWLTHQGSVGKVLGEATLHICDDHGNELAARQEGAVYFNSKTQFRYHNDPEKTAESRNKQGWSTLGDVGYLDEEGYLYLTDRKSFMIISGGVNIYPQEIENHLVTHPKVADVAVIGGPHEEMGEEVIAVVQPVDMADADDAFRDDLIAYAREKLSGVKMPRRIDFMAELPRHDTGKLYKRLLRDSYWTKR